MKKRAFSLFLAVLMCGLIVFSSAAAAADIDAAATGDDHEMLNVPQIRVITADSNGLTLQKADGYVNAAITITDTDGSVLSENVQFKVRGNTTAMTSIKKKAYTFKFEKKKNVLGLGSGKKWALLANVFDPTLLRNVVANTIAHELDLPYTSNQRFVELWVDDSYRGCYGLYEPVEEGKDRVNIDIKSNNGMKDFLIEYEASREEEDVTYFTVEGLRFLTCDPESPNEEQLAYITGTMERIIGTLKTGTRDEIEQVLDVDSFAKYYFLNEYVKTFDFDMSSVKYFYQDGKLYAGPAWDYDLSAGNSNDSLNNHRYKEAVPTNGLYCNQKNIYRFICDKDWFMEVVRQVYREHYDFFCDVYAEGGMMDRQYAEYGDIFARNFASDCWKVSQGWINIQKKPLATYQDNYDYLQNWYKERNLWLTEYFDPMPEGVLLGDANGDGAVTIMDATAVQRYLARFTVMNPYAVLHRGDVSGDGLDISDATAIQRWLASFSVSYAVGQPIG